MEMHSLFPPRYINVSVKAILDADLSDGAARTCARLCGLAWESKDENKMPPALTIGELAAICHRRRSAMWAHLRILRERGYITWRTVSGQLLIRILQRPGLVQESGLPSAAVAAENFTTGHFFKDAKISYTENAEKAQRYTEMLKIG